jgi:hypothetical protein
MELQEIKKWVDTFYQGSTTQGKVEINTFNDKYTLCYIKGHSGYTGRISGSVYSSSEWFVVETLAKNERGVFGFAPKRLFTIEGRLTKEHKTKIKQDYDLTVIETAKKDKVVNDPDTYIIALHNDAFWGRGFSSVIMCYKLVKEEDYTYITFSKGDNKNVRINKNKYYTVKVKESEKDAVLSELSELVKDYNIKSSELDTIRTNITSKFKK